jgi:hypothetical protein
MVTVAFFFLKKIETVDARDVRLPNPASSDGSWMLASRGECDPGAAEK